jgi:ABC-type oligopeptide transport system substrate-binding subunit/DNA-binding SARP family transcriptional activator
MSLRIQFLGPPKVERDGDPVDLPGYRPLALLAYLLVTGQAHTRQHLVDLLFEGADDPRAALRWTLTKLRQAIGGEYILADRQQVAFDFESDYWLDVTAFEAGQTELYRGEFLEGLALRDAFRFEDWAFFERERLKGRYQQGLAERIEAYEGTGDDAAIVETAHQLLRLDNLREDWYRALMAAYARLGRRDAALAQFEQCRQVLKAELDVEPARETMALAEAIRQGEGIERHRRAGKRSVLPPLPRTPSPVRFPTALVGRSAEMATLHQTWQKAANGQGQIMLVEGEPGIGKTRLVEELLVDVAAQAVILRAKCPDMYDPLAYTLFIDPLRQALEREPAPELSQSWLAEIGRLLPELRDRFPYLNPPASSEAAVERRRLFDAVCTTLLAMVEQQPLILFLDDIQWADPTSLELLNHFSSRIHHVPVLIVGAYRPHEVKAGHPLQEARRHWLRAGLLTSLELAPLSDLSVAELLRELTTWQGDDPSFGDLIYRETAGNPLFIVETIANLRDEGHLPHSAEDWQRDFRAESVTIPRQVQTLIEARLNRLDDVSRQIITTAAVMRGSFRAATLQTVSGRSEWETMEGLEHLLAAGLLVEREPDEFTFSHDKIRQVAYSGLSHLRRKLLHRRVAESVEKQHRDRENTVAARLAYHYEQAGVEDKALDYHLQSARAAQEQYAYAAAIEHYQKAVALLKAREDFEQAAQVSMQLGLVQHQVFDFEGAQHAYQEAFALEQQAGQPQPTSAPHPLRVTSYAEPASLDPTGVAEAGTSLIISQLFSGLVTENREMELRPDLAQSWEILDGGQKYVFHLRQDARWSDGVPVTAADFVYAWRRVLRPTGESAVAELLFDLKGARAYREGELDGPEAVGVSAPERHTLLVELERPSGYFLNLLATPATFPVPRHAVEQYGQAWASPEQLVCNGPFKLDAWQPGQTMHLSRNPHYHGGFSGNVEQVEVFFGLDEQAELMMYEAGRLDVAQAYQRLEAIRQSPAEEQAVGPLERTFYLDFDMSRPPLDDARVRRALVMAIDRGRWGQGRLADFGVPALGGFVPAGMPGYSPQIGLPYDPEQAGQLLAAAGYPGGRAFPTLDWLVAEGLIPLADDLERQWAQNLGITRFNRSTALWPTLLERAQMREPNLLVAGWVADVVDPDNFLRVCIAEQRLQGWQNQDYESVIEQARATLDQQRRLDLYRQADRILIEAAALMPLMYGRSHLLIKPWVKQYAYRPHSTLRWQEVIIEPHL